MPKYRVLVDFKDTQDKYKKYEKGAPYPRPANKKVDPARIEELKTKKSRKGVPFIEELEPEVEEKDDEDSTKE